MTTAYNDNVEVRKAKPFLIHPTLKMQSWSFVVGSSLFAIGSAPVIGNDLGTVGANTCFFIGAWFFTAAAFMQVQLSGPRTVEVPGRVAIRAVWLAAAIQFFGTLMFNVSTGAALHTRALTAEREFVWAPNAEGSIAFLVSAGLACFVLLRDKEYWRPGSKDWWSIWLNFAGSVAFGISAVGSIISSNGKVLNPSWADWGTFIGALCFLLASAIYLVGRNAAEEGG